jgi:hypothetical protein
MQHNILAGVLGRKDFLCSTTLWMEGGKLFGSGNLSIPENTIVVFTDTGWTQMWGADFHQAPRRKPYRYGGYYHVAFWGAGPHLAQITSPEKIYYNFKQAVEKGDTDYSILNVSNIREFSEGIRQVAEPVPGRQKDEPSRSIGKDPETSFLNYSEPELCGDFSFFRVPFFIFWYLFLFFSIVFLISCCGFSESSLIMVYC